MNRDAEDLTLLLRELNEGEEGALDKVMERAYSILRRIADRRLRARYGPDLAGISLEPAALVNETFLRLIKQRAQYDSSGHFFAIATRLMMRVLKDYQRRQNASKRGGDQVRVSLSQLRIAPGTQSAAEVPAFIEAMENLEKMDACSAEIAQLRVIWGLTMSEIAECLGKSVSTIERDWQFSRKWLAQSLDLHGDAQRPTKT